MTSRDPEFLHLFIPFILPHVLTPVLLFLLQRSEDDVSQFDTKFTKQIPVDSPEESMLSESANMMFQVSVHLHVPLPKPQFDSF
jgi:hypothetical protein